jgi:short-subunit dehydrogenase
MMGKFKYEGTALITGASSGLGEEFARQLAAKGMDLILVARSKSKLEEMARELGTSVKVHVVAADLAEEHAAKKVKAETDRLGLEVDLLVNNAGIGTHGLFHEIDPDTEHQMIMLNCVAPVDLAQQYVRGMVERNRGGIIFLASVAAYQPTPYFASYGATKAFNLLLGEAMWAELQGTGVSVLSLSPGYTKTKFQETADVHLKPPGGFKTADEVVRTALQKLGRKLSVIPGKRNKFAAWSIRFTPRGMAAKIAKSISKPRT